MSADNGGPAFPVCTANAEYGHLEDNIRWQFPGMTLRDYFAANAMQGWLASYGADAPLEAAIAHTDGIARLAYSLADAMLKERAK